MTPPLEGSTPERQHILVADGNRQTRERVRRLLAVRFDVRAVPDRLSLHAAIAERAPDLIIVDLALSSQAHFDLLKILKADRRSAHTPIVLVAPDNGEAEALQGLAAGADDYLTKPFAARELVARVAANLQLARSRWQATLNLRRSEARLAFALRAGRLGSWELDLETRTLTSSDIYKSNWGRSASEEFTYETLLSAIHPDDREQHEIDVAEATATGGTLDIEYRAIWPDGSIHWLRVRGHAVYDENGKPIRMAGISLDVTDRRETEESLRDETFTLETLNRVGTTLAGDLDLENIVQTVIDAATDLSGAQFGAFLDGPSVGAGDRPSLYARHCDSCRASWTLLGEGACRLIERTLKETTIVRSDDIRADVRNAANVVRFGDAQESVAVASYLAVPVISRSGEVLGGMFFGHEKPNLFTERIENILVAIAAQAAIAIDNARLFQAKQNEIAERARAESQLKLLLAELNHRVKNTLAIVQSIASQTLRHTDTAEAFRSGFESRIMALSEAHNLLTDHNWAGASLRDIIERVLTPYSDADRTRYTLGKSDVRVGPKTAVSLVMAFHELTTNAAKYGALSNATGRVSVDWHVDRTRDPPHLVVKWVETAGPPVKEPTRKGFGSRLIRGLAYETAGEVKLEFVKAGLVGTFDIPLLERI